MILQGYVLRRLVVAMGSSLVGLFLLLLPPLLLSAVSRLGGVGMQAVAGYLPYMVIELFPYLLPLSFLLAIVATFSRMADEGEWTALQMAGIHPVKASLMGVVLAFATSAGAFLLLHEVFPPLRYAQSSYRYSSAVDVIRGLLPGRTVIQAGRWAVVAKRRTGNVLEDVAVRIPTETGEPGTSVVAERAQLASEERGLRLTLRNALALDDEGTVRTETLDVFLPFAELVKVQSPDGRNPKYMSTREVLAKLRPIEDPRDAWALRLRYEVHKRNALAFCYVVFLLIGVPVGLRLRTSSLLPPVAIVAGISCVYYVVSLRFGKESAIVGYLPPWVGAWAANVLAVAAALILMLWWRRR